MGKKSEVIALEEQGAGTDREGRDSRKLSGATIMCLIGTWVTQV